ncbi:Asp-tRNA(Asn)/Glu-tRNA(Gln) amidotransferase subunit GatB [Helicobacter sp. 13S00401-1]|uniref:Asp-tRNA(Asn)/Glu-tRNA(Gln) amidotransferase subunit GatB n=1 Tax=Helicobacter sp. 13S00401-1 TaxID=1905758 RepID=UPI000BA5DB3F|nr:Asp-tRNA(Asn)/Glu-tRNA(Gln) amidotransferase subunit GatB [Helicobacter sp. 13S00401-1]
MFETIIGLEVHVQLNTKTKIFCSCATSFGEAPNTNVCPTCLGLPGALPVLNKEALFKALLFGNAINAKINNNSIFARKNYFYPDLPKAYQISQFETPVVGLGYLDIETEDGLKTIGITRAHLEEDAGKNIHEDGFSEVDLNRACTPLLEIVSEPDLRSASEAVSYLKKLRSIVQFLEISDANMQEGSFRCDANVSIRPKGDSKLYTRVEIKNLNSFKFIAKAIEYEVERQTEAWEAGTYKSEVVQETRLFDTNSSTTRSMRNKEESADYRYFPDPDLLPVHIDEEMMERAKKIPELPDSKRKRYVEMGIKDELSSLLVSDIGINKYFENMLSLGVSPKNASTWLGVELLGRLKEGRGLEALDSKKLSYLVKKIEDSTISAKSAKDVLDRLLEDSSLDIDALIKDMGLAQVSDEGAILKVIESIIANNPEKVAEYKGGKDKLLGFFVGQVMKEQKGVNPSVVNKLLKQKLDS